MRRKIPLSCALGVQTMLDQFLKPLRYDQWDREEWQEYCERVGVPEERAVREFYRQVVYDHFDHHNNHYPDFEISDYRFGIIQLTVSGVREHIHFFPGDKVEDMWGAQYDWFEKENQDYIIYQAMSKNKTPPFPPVIIDSSNLIDEGWRTYGRPLHLVEGTHRVSYLIHMAKRGLITWESSHEFVLLSPNDSPPPVK